MEGNMVGGATGRGRGEKEVTEQWTNRVPRGVKKKQ